MGLPSSDPNLADPIPLTRPRTLTRPLTAQACCRWMVGPRYPSPVGDRTHRPLTARWMALDDKRVAFGAATDTEEAMRSYAAGLQVGYLLWPTCYGLFTMAYLRWAVALATSRTSGYLLWLHQPYLLTMAAGGLPRLLRHAIRQTACRRECRRRDH